MDLNGRLLAVDSSDMLEFCLPSDSLETKHFENSVPASILFEQASVSKQSSDFTFMGYAELIDDFGDRSVWYYFSTVISGSEADDATTEDGSKVAWVDRE